MILTHAKKRAYRFLLFLGVFILLAGRIEAIGPRNVTSSGLSVQWSSMPVTVHLESDLDVRGKDVSSLVQNALAAWTNLSDSDVSFTLDTSTIGVPVDNSNICSFLYDSSQCPQAATNDGINPLIIDEDGTIMQDFFGDRFGFLGFASISISNSSTGAAVKGGAVFNAACLTGFSIPECPEGVSFSDDDFTSFIVHETGHFLGLDHSQVNLDEATDDLNGDGSVDADDSFITTMFPIFIVGNGADFKTPERDDAVGLAQLYPAGSFASSTWKITGTVYAEGGGSEFQCANLVARNTASLQTDAISAIAGDFSPANSDEGNFEILGLAAGTAYRLDVEPIDSDYTGPSGYTPCRGTGGDPSPPQFVSFTSSGTFSGVAGQNKIVNCTLGGDCVLAGSSSSGGGGGSGGCSLIP